MQSRMRDDIGRELYFGTAPRRVVSLVPSETDNLFALGLGDRIVARTDACAISVDGVLDIPTVGEPMTSDIEAILDLGADLVLANKEENSRSALETLAQRGVRVFVGFPQSVRDGVGHLARLARMFRVSDDPQVRSIIKGAYDCTSLPPPVPTRRVFAVMSMDPLVTPSNGTYAHDVLRWCGAENVFAEREIQPPRTANIGKATPLIADDAGGRDSRYRPVTLDEMKAAAPDLILIPDTPHSHTEQDVQMFRDLGTGADIRFVSGKDLFWPGARTVGAIDRLRAIITV